MRPAAAPPVGTWCLIAGLLAFPAGFLLDYLNVAGTLLGGDIPEHTRRVVLWLAAYAAAVSLQAAWWTARRLSSHQTKRGA